MRQINSKTKEPEEEEEEEEYQLQGGGEYESLSKKQGRKRDGEIRKWEGGIDGSERNWEILKERESIRRRGRGRDFDRKIKEEEGAREK